MRYILYILLFMMPALCSAQADRSHIRSGNRAFHQDKEDSPQKAELHYRKAVAANPNNAQALYNLGDALLAQNKDSSAFTMFQKASQIETSKQRKAMAYHNMGVIMQRQQQYGQAIECYKQALRLAPHDNETRYNLVLCMRSDRNSQKNNNQNGNNKKNQDNDKNKDKNKNNDQNKNNDKNKDNDKNNDKNKQKQKQEPQPQQMSKENAEQLLQAAMQNEKATQQRLKKAMAQPRHKILDKNW